jgi:hypothetical protein
MIVTKYTSEDMKRLPLRAIAALSARIARRIAPRALLPDNHPEAGRYRTALENAIKLTEDFAKGLPCPALESAVREIESCEGVVAGDFVRETALHAIVLTAHTAATALHVLELRAMPGESPLFAAAKPSPFPHLADLSADLTARDAFTAALTAADADARSDTFIKRGVDDYQKLLELNLGSYPQAGEPIDPSSKGPLGPLGTGESL